jgi:hypothetical protein
MTEKPQLPKKFLIIKIILETAEKSQTTLQLIKAVQVQTGLEENEIVNLIIELENEGKIHLAKKETQLPSTLRGYVFSKHTTWYWITCTVAVLTAISVFAIDEKSSLIFIRSALGLVFVLFLPGFAFIKMLFPQNLPIQTNNNNIDNIERVALSIALSLVLTPIVGLIINYTPWGITLTPITLSLLALTIVFANAAIIREHQTKQQP